MSVRVVLPGPLRELVGGSAVVELAATPATVGEALGQLRAGHPAVYERLVTERGEVRPHVNVFVGTEDIRWSGGLETPVREGSELVVLQSVSGG